MIETAQYDYAIRNNQFILIENTFSHETPTEETSFLRRDGFAYGEEYAYTLNEMSDICPFLYEQNQQRGILSMVFVVEDNGEDKSVRGISVTAKGLMERLEQEVEAYKLVPIVSATCEVYAPKSELHKEQDDISIRHFIQQQQLAKHKGVSRIGKDRGDSVTEGRLLINPAIVGNIYDNGPYRTIELPGGKFTFKTTMPLGELKNLLGIDVNEVSLGLDEPQ